MIGTEIFLCGYDIVFLSNNHGAKNILNEEFDWGWIAPTSGIRANESKSDQNMDFDIAWVGTPYLVAKVIAMTPTGATVTRIVVFDSVHS